MNLPTIIILLCLGVLLALALRYSLKKKSCSSCSSKDSCTGSDSGCAGCTFNQPGSNNEQSPSHH